MAITVEELQAEWATPGHSMRDVKTPGGRKGMITEMEVQSGYMGAYDSQILLTVQVLGQKRPYLYAPEDLDWWAS